MDTGGGNLSCHCRRLGTITTRLGRRRRCWGILFGWLGDGLCWVRWGWCYEIEGGGADVDIHGRRIQWILYSCCDEDGFQELLVRNLHLAASGIDIMVRVIGD